MDKILKPLLISSLGALLISCQNLTTPAPAGSANASVGQARAQASCSGCHAIGRYGMSSNQNAPPFHAIANQQGLTAETLSRWLRDAHNYPAEMDFSLVQREAEELVAYLLTLRDPDYRQPPG